MSVNINTNSSNIAENAVCNLMPCRIHVSGHANVSTYFKTITEETTSKDTILKSSFRGKPLEGQELVLPEDYVGVVLARGSGSGEEDCKADNWNVKHKFNKFTYWNWDKLPSSNDKICQALVWPDIADAMHNTPENKEN